MRFWDASAVVALLLDQSLSERARRLLDQDPDVVIWWGTPIECASAFTRLRREGSLGEAEEGALAHRLERLRLGWYEMIPGDRLRAHALRVLRLHPLRAVDALQLAAALEWAGSPAGGAMVTFDERLAAAAEREEFSVEGG